MAKTLTIAGVDYLGKYQTGSASIRETQRKSNSMSLTFVVGDIADAPQQGAEIVFMDGSRFLFGGYISRVKPKELGKGQRFTYDVEASDYSYIFNGKIVKRGYQAATLKAIVEDIISDFVGAGYGFDTTGVQVGPEIASVVFDHISVKKCFEKLQKLTGYVWGVDYEKNLTFGPETAAPAPESFTDAAGNATDISIAYDAAQVRNSVTVIGSDEGVESLDPVIETFDGDGDTRSWELEERPSSIEHIKINGVSKQFSLDVNMRASDVFTYSFQAKSFQLTEGQTTPVGGGTPDEIEVKYYPRIPIIEVREDSASVAFFQGVEGGDGKHEYTIKDGTITTLQEAADRATRELEAYASPLVDGRVKTRSGILASAANVFKAGQYLTLNLPTYGLATDTAFLIQEVMVTMEENGTDTEYFYDIKFGGKVIGVEQFLEYLASQQAEGEQVQDAAEILTLKHVTEALEFAEDSVASSVVTPPFKYGSASTPKGVYGLSEYGA